MCQKCFGLTGAKWGEAAVGTAGGVVTWSLARGAGQFLDYDAFIGANSVFANLIRKAFGAWESVANISFREVSDGPATDIRLAWTDMDGPYNTLGRATWQFSNRRDGLDEMRRAEIQFDQGENWNVDNRLEWNEVDFYATAAHEIGHAIGLGHSGASDSLMHATQKRDNLDLKADDISGIRAIYGPPEAPVSRGGTAGDDLIYLTANLKHINAFAGLDTVVVFGSRNAYDHQINDDGRVVLTERASGEIDYLDNVERIRFTDGTLAADIDGQVSKAYRLYQAAFDRTPDTGGLTHWTRILDEGHLSLQQSADRFTKSAEFSKTYGPIGQLSNDDFVVLLYQNVLGRDPEPAGRANWNSVAESGVPRGNMLAGFSESHENKLNVQTAIDDGIWLV